MTGTKWLTISAAAEYLSLSEHTVRKLIQLGDLPAHRVGAVEIRLDVDEIDEFVRSRTYDGPFEGRRPKKMRTI